MEASIGEQYEMEKPNKQEKEGRVYWVKDKGWNIWVLARRLSVSKQTLIKWSKETNVKEAIDAVRVMRYQSILKAYEQDRLSKIECFVQLDQKVKSELLKWGKSSRPDAGGPALFFKRLYLWFQNSNVTWLLHDGHWNRHRVQVGVGLRVADQKNLGRAFKNH